MTFAFDTHAGTAPFARVPEAADELICWSRMQSEAGQGLNAIIARKECERLAGHRTFFWGVGNAPALLANVLARLHRPVPVVFSIMKSRPKLVDISPRRTVVWRKYIDAEGVERDLPAQALITSRGDSASGAKKVHYALECRSDVPLTLKRGQSFDPTAYRNAGGTKAPVGASQVTALLQRVRPDHLADQYEVNLEATLTGSYWVRLTQPLELTEQQRTFIEDLQGCTPDQWLELVRTIRGGSSARPPEPGTLL